MRVKFQIGELLGIGLTLVVLGIGLAYGLNVMGDVKQDMTRWGSHGCNETINSNCTMEINATMDAIAGVAKIPEKLPTIATVIVASVIICILVTYLWGKFQ